MAVILKPIKRQRVYFTIRGLSPLIQHKWSEKALREIREKKGGKKTRDRTPTDPDAEFSAAAYLTEDGQYGIPLLAFKAALISAAHKDLGIEKTLVRKALFIPSDDAEGVIPMDADAPIMREDCVRVGQGGTDLRYRPEFREWRVDITAEIDSDLLKVEDLITLVNRAGFGVGIGEWRPEKGGENGRFEVDSSFKVSAKEI